ncbi:MAG: GAF domain-containing sensor histidine kinase [Mariniphaga sp.]
MIFPDIPQNELMRIAALKDYSILDTIPEQEYDDITFLASRICKTPISLISLIDNERQWFKSHHGIEATETPRGLAFCAHAINDKNNILIVPDSRKDLRFHDNPLVTNNPHVVFYAGIPLVNKEGFPLGTLCVIDNEPNSLDEFQLKALKALSNQIISLFELRKKTAQLEIKARQVEAQNIVLEKFAGTAAHDLKSPLATIVMVTELFELQYADRLDKEGLELVQMINTSAFSLSHFIDGILNYSQNTKVLSDEKEEVSIHSIIDNIIHLIDSNKEIHLVISPDDDFSIFTNKVAVEQIFLNLLVNAVKYNDKDIKHISVIFEEQGDYFMFNIIDNGQGIKYEDQERIFQIFETTSNADKSGLKGTGIGLATVKWLVEGMGGTIHLTSEVGKGANFEFTLHK